MTAGHFLYMSKTPTDPLASINAKLSKRLLNITNDDLPKSIQSTTALQDACMGYDLSTTTLELSVSGDEKVEVQYSHVKVILLLGQVLLISGSLWIRQTLKHQIYELCLPLPLRKENGFVPVEFVIWWSLFVSLTFSRLGVVFVWSATRFVLY